MPASDPKLDDIIASVLEGIRHTLSATACSVWLVEPSTGDLICQHSTDPKGSSIHGWRLAPGQGIAGWVTVSKRGTIVSDTRLDRRHASEVDKLTGMECRSILAVPMLTKRSVIGVIEVVDSRPNRFTANDLHLVESLASTAAIAIESMRFYTLKCRSEINRERSRLARELHDSVMQTLYSIELAARASLALLERTGKDVDPEVLSLSHHVLALTHQVSIELRESIYDLEAENLAGRTLGTMLANHCAVLRERYHLGIGLSIDREPGLSLEQKVMLYNIAREALWNVVKHACASCVEVKLAREDNDLVLCIG